MILRLSRVIGRFRRNVSGASAVEFALIAPVLILFYFGLAEYTQALIAQRRNGSTASAIGDLVAQANGAIAAGDIDDIMDMKKVLMNPFPVANKEMKICIASILNTNGQNKVTWRRAQNDTACPTVNSTVADVPSALITNGLSVIMSRVSYSYTSPVSDLIDTPVTFSKTYYLRPRRSTQIVCANC